MAIILWTYGLALSSRNQLLSNNGLVTAGGLKRHLDTLKEIYIETGSINESVNKTLNTCQDSKLDIDYLHILDKDTFDEATEETSETNVGVGNSTKWESYRYTTRKTITSDELLMMFKTTIDLSKLNDKAVDGVIVCSVVPQITDSVVSAISEFTTKDVLVVGPGIKTGLKVNIDNPKELGPDRIANSVGGFKKTNKEVVIVDLGTATTFDVVNSNKEYLGGSIAPGIKISLDALISKTSSLKSVELKEPDKVIGKNTYEAIQSGLVLGHASMIDSMLEKIVMRKI